jgi:FAD/FMN-containing dehydrogenase
MSAPTPSLAGDKVQELATRVRGRVVRPTDSGYDQACTVQNGLINRRPGLIVECTGVADVIAAVDFAREQGLLLSVRAGGHNVAGNAVNDDGLVVDLSRMRGVHVDAKARTARVQGGATWGDLDRETQVFGLATPGGVVSTTGVAGLTLHGGFGHLRRPFGLSIDNLLSVDIVTADGKLRTASESENPDLYWAVRGAGSNFGVVTSFEFRLHPVGPLVTLGAVMYHLDDAELVMRKWRSFIQELPDDLFTPIALFWSVPPGMPPEAVGTPVCILAGVHAGPLEQGEKVIAPMRSFAKPVLDLSGPAPFTAVQAAFDPFFPKGQLMYWKSTYVEWLSDELLDAVCGLARTRPSPQTTMDIWPMEGAAARVPANATSFGERRPYMIAFESTWTDPSTNDANIRWARDAHASMSRFASEGIYLNFPGFGEEKVEMAKAAYGENFGRLTAVKAKYDPDNLFRMNINIPPGVAAELQPA